MAFSREVRLPFLNHELVEFIFSLPSHYKVHAGWSKYVLRKAMEKILPVEITWRKDKIGYEPPQKQWMKNPKIVEQISDFKSDLTRNGIIKKEAVFTEEQDFAVLNIGHFLASAII
jgi:asparagine synthase (glutamine-hydrolysing)